MTTTEQLLHLADRARRGVALDAEHDQLTAGIAALGERAARAEATVRALSGERAPDSVPEAAPGCDIWRRENGRADLCASPVCARCTYLRRL
ncbi:hypothetical protein OG599_35290 (plasmid) [Streptomyces sp. NBC_01335]|uniref:hypothetical protein n=1 Tax=Streptomyces sp. NBC_01335 TaxID=2903828 RepID=UPI002E156F76|nr:hypothetical protein OG599_35290 [Streptomyces sp. NBC_01335]